MCLILSRTPDKRFGVLQELVPEPIKTPTSVATHLWSHFGLEEGTPVTLAMAEAIVDILQMKYPLTLEESRRVTLAGHWQFLASGYEQEAKESGQSVPETYFILEQFFNSIMLPPEDPVVDALVPLDADRAGS
jgi:hypothetical protein